MRVLLEIFLAMLLVGQTTDLRAQPSTRTQLWTYVTSETISGSPAIGPDGTVYFAHSVLVAVTNAGSNRWVFPLGASADNNSSPAVAVDGTVYVSRGNLFAIKPDGSQKWAYASGSGRGSPAIGLNDEIYIEGYRSLYCISGGGAIIWSNVMGGASRYGSPVIAPGRTIYAPSPQNAILHALKSDGNEIWTAGIGFSEVNSPAIAADGTIYATSFGLSAFSPNGTNLWTNTTNLFANSSPAIGKDGTVFVASYGGGSLFAITLDGAVKWRTVLAPDNSTNAPIAATPAIDTAGNLYYPVFNTLYALSSTGSVIWTFSPSNGANTYTSPAIGPDGTIYVTFGNTLYAIYNTNKLADSPWPMYRQNARHTGKVEKPSLQKPQKRADASFQFEIYGQVGVTNTIQGSPDLTNWSPLADVLITNVPTDFIDLDSTNFPSRYYRALGPPLP